MQHYYHPMSRAVSTHWMLMELGVEYEQIDIDLNHNENTHPAFRAINPMAKLPVLVDGEITITEVAAICAYLADKYPEKGLAPLPGTQARGHYYRCLFLAGNTIEPAMALAASQLSHPNPKSAGWGDLTRVLTTIEAIIPETQWLLGRQFSAADIVLGGLLDSLLTFGPMEVSAKVQAYVERLRQRPCYQATHSAFIALRNHKALS